MISYGVSFDAAPTLFALVAKTDWGVAAPYVAAAVALFVGLMTALLSWANARRTIEQQRALSREERLWDKRAEAYVDLLEWSEGVAAAMHKTMDEEAFTNDSDAEPAALAVMPSTLRARIRAYGSDAIVEGVDRLTELSASTAAKLDEARSSGLQVAQAGTRLLLTLELVTALKNLRVLVRRELQLVVEDVAEEGTRPAA